MVSFAPIGDPFSSSDGGPSQKKRVAYCYESDIANFSYGTGHPMQPRRALLTHDLIMAYGLYKDMSIHRLEPASALEMTMFHTDEYIKFLRTVTPDNMDRFAKEQKKFNVGGESPIFEGLFEFCGISAGGSLEGASRLNRGKADMSVNWAGGLHHAKKCEASGFCYVNDAVLGILELLRFHKRVLYIDIDFNHGDGVEEAFYTTDRVLTVSFHRNGKVFPGTGKVRDIGVGAGKYYSINFPLKDGIDDLSYKAVFEPVIAKAVEYYLPEAIVLQCGAGSLSGDRLGSFNLSMKGHANCVKFVRDLNIPTLVLGGGGFTMSNVARTWAFETGVLIGRPMTRVLPYCSYYEYYSPDYELDVRASNATNENSENYLNKTLVQVMEYLKHLPFAPSVPITAIPRQSFGMTDEKEDEANDADEENKDVRSTQYRRDKMVVDDDAYVNDSKVEDEEGLTITE